MSTHDTVSPPLVAVDANAGRSSIAVVLASLLGTGLNALLGLLIGIVLGEGPETDAFLAAYSVYLVFLLFGATLRGALLPLLGSGRDEDRLRARATEVLARIGATGLGVAAVIALTAPLTGFVLTAGASGGGFGTAALTLAILAPATYFQIVGAAQSAVLAAGQRFTASASIYVASSATTLVLAVLLMEVLKAPGAALGVLAGAAVLAAGHHRYLHRFGLAAHPRPRLLRDRETYRMAASALAGAALPLAFQVNLTIALAAVAGAVGVVTAYTYAYLVPVLLTSLTGASIGLVSMPLLVADIEHRGRAAAEDYVRAFTPLGAFLYVPAAAAIAWFGEPVIDAALAGALSPHTLDVLVDLMLGFLLMGTAWSLAAPVSTLAIVLRRYRALTTIALVSLPVQAIAVAAAATTGARAAGLAHAAVGVAMVIAVGVDVLRGRALAVGAAALARSLPAFAFALVFPALAAVTPDGWVANLAMSLLGLAIYLGLALAFWPDVRRRILALTR